MLDNNEIKKVHANFALEYANETLGFVLVGDGFNFAVSDTV